MKKSIKKLSAALVSVSLLVTAVPTTVFAQSGYIGYFGGITEGKRLPKTSETLLQLSQNTKAQSYTYKEYVLMDKTPTLFEGEMTIASKEPEVLADKGTYNVTLTVGPTDTSDSEAKINREITFKVNYYKDEDKNVIKDYSVLNWEETVSSASGKYTLDEKKSYFDVSVVENYTPGVMYYKGDISSKAYYSGGQGEDGDAEVTKTGSIFGYNSAWSNTETHRIDAYVKNGPDSFTYQIRPSVTVYKDLQYGNNEPTYTSFDGNYREVMANESGLFYTILNKSNSMYLTETKGNASIDSRNYFEQLPPVNLTSLKGAPYYNDLEKLYGMGVLQGDPNLFKPTQAITRGEFVTMLVRAFKLPTTAYESTKKASAKTAQAQYYADVTPTRNDYKYIQTAKDYGVAYGSSDGHFYPDQTISRQEAICMIVRSLGLQNMGITGNPQSPFLDDKDIATWAKNDLYTAYKIGIINTGTDFKVNPKQKLSKADAAVIVNAMIDYLRYDLKENYAESIVNYVENQ